MADAAMILFAPRRKRLRISETLLDDELETV